LCSPAAFRYSPHRLVRTGKDSFGAGRSGQLHRDPEGGDLLIAGIISTLLIIILLAIVAIVAIAAAISRAVFKRRPRGGPVPP
jgi:hypothetical protein